MCASLALKAKSRRRLKSVISTTLLALGLVASAASATEQNPESWLMRMAHALQRNSYEGTFVYLNGNHLESMRVIHTVDERGEREHLISLNGAEREIVRDGHAVTRILPHARSVFTRRSTHESSFPLVLGESFNSLQAHYGFHLGGSDRIAERKTQQVLVVPRDRLRYGYRLWLDDATAIPLKVALVNERGRPLEQVMFTQFKLIDGERLPKFPTETPTPVVKKTPPAETAPGPADNQWQIGELPNGFQLREQGEEKVPGSPRSIHHLVFSDGLVSVSVYIESMDEQRGLSGASRRGSISAFGKYQSGLQVTVVGEVPPTTVEQIAHSIRMPVQ